MSAIPLQHVRGRKWLERIAKFRVQVWNQDGSIDATSFTDGQCLEATDAEAIHVVVLDGETLIAAIRFNSYATLSDCPLAQQYRAAGIDVPGPVAVPERLVVAEKHRRRGILSGLADHMLELCQQYGCRSMISECSPATADMLRKRGRQSLGYAPHDPRFPHTRYEWMLTDIEAMHGGS